MSIQVMCDGCGKAAEDFVEHGQYRKVQYCPDCDTRFIEYLTARDDLHDDMMEMWAGKMQGIRKHYDFALPDA